MTAQTPEPDKQLKQRLVVGILALATAIFAFATAVLVFAKELVIASLLFIGG